MSLISTLPIAKIALTNNLAPMGRICLSINKNMLHDNSNKNTKEKPKMITKIKQSKIFNRKNKNTQYQNIRREKKKSQKIPPPPSGSHPIKNTLIFLGGAAIFSFLFTGWPSKDDNPYDIDEWINRSKKQIKKLTEEPFTSKILPDELPEPHCQKYTLLINLDDNLINTTWDPESGWHVVKRPGVDFFIQYLSQFYEIVIFSNGKPEASAPIIDNIDPHGFVLNRLYHKDLKSITRQRQRDLRSLNRDIKKSIVLDIDKSLYKQHENNVISIPPWDGKKDDNELFKLIPFFESLIITSPQDIRPVLKSYSGQILSDGFLKHQNQLREKFEKQNKEILKMRELKKLEKQKQKEKENKGILGALFGGRDKLGLSYQEEEEELEDNKPLVNPVSEMDNKRKEMRKAFFNQRSEWASMADEQRRLTMESIENQFNSNEEVNDDDLLNDDVIDDEDVDKDDVNDVIDDDDDDVNDDDDINKK